MREHRLIVCLAIGILLLLFFSFPKANCQDYFEYTVQLNNDSSAVWTITQFSSVSSPVDSWTSFQEKIFALVNSAASLTHRAMEIDENSMQIKSTISLQTKITEYSFIWQNCSVIKGDKMLFGDVFEVNNFFSQLYGDAAIKLSYPPDLSVESVSPPPNERQDSAQMLEWARTHDLVSGASIVLTPATVDNVDDNILPYVIIAISAAGVAAGLGFFAIKRHRDKRKNSSKNIVDTLLTESEEDKVIKILKASGGSMRQSEITERCRFSKAKTSQLLTALESSGIITRYKKGRDKIVTLKERVKGE